MNRWLATLMLLSWSGCDGGGKDADDTDVSDDTDTTADDTDTTPADDTDPPATTGCALYCEQLSTNCTGDNAQYLDEADCMSFCEASGWPDGDAGAQGGNSIACRIYHGGAPAAGDPASHCPHAGPTGATVCGTVAFRTDAPATYTRVDAMGMPAVATALIGSARKDAYNDASPDSSGFAGDFVASLTGLHAALDDDLIGLGLAPCDMDPNPDCVTQEYGPGATVGSLVLDQDDLTLNPAMPAGFPNGRALANPVIDITLAALLLDLDGGLCGGAPCTAATIAGFPLNPGANDVAFLSTFPYVAPSHAP